MVRREARLSLSVEAQSRASTVARMMGARTYLVPVTMLLGGQLAEMEARLDVEGRRMLHELAGLLGLPVITDDSQQRMVAALDRVRKAVTS
jgi:hypothetical protein